MKAKNLIIQSSFLTKLLLRLSGCLFILTCSKESPSSSSYQRELESLLSHQPENAHHARFLLIYQLSQTYLQAGDYNGALTFFAKERLGMQEKDPYLSFYYYLLGQIYENSQQNDIASLYYETIVRNFADLEINNQSIHKIVLEKLLKLETNPYLQEQYNAILLERFSPKSTLAEKSFWNYRMATILETLGRWEEAINYYQIFLHLGYFNLPENITRQNPNVYENIRNKIIFHNSSKNWVFRSLEDLVNNIKSSVWNLNANKLEKLKNQTSFFIRTWNQQLETAAVDTDNTSDSDIDTLGFFREFLNSSKSTRGISGVRFEENFNTESSQKMLYLGSSGWYRINQWYFVFRQVDYPLDPEINGSWEWIGIYLGEKP